MFTDLPLSALTARGLGSFVELLRAEVAWDRHNLLLAQSLADAEAEVKRRATRRAAGLPC